MADLRALQERFFSLVTAREDVPGALARLGLGPEDAARLVRGDARLDAAGRIGIYNDMYFLRLLDVLRDDFSDLAQALGEDDFRALTADYLEAHPPVTPSLRHLGRALPAFLAGHELGRSRPWLADLAAFEWARADAFDRPDAEPLTLAALAQLPPEALAALPLTAVPSAAWLDAGFAVDEIWRRLEAEPALAPPARPVRILVWRQGTDVVHRRAGSIEATVLPALIATATPGAAPVPFAALCESLGEGRAVEDAARIAFELLAKWAREGLLARTEVGPGT